jgi:hypothetical protein
MLGWRVQWNGNYMPVEDKVTTKQAVESIQWGISYFWVPPSDHHPNPDLNLLPSQRKMGHTQLTPARS